MWVTTLTSARGGLRATLALPSGGAQAPTGEVGRRLRLEGAARRGAVPVLVRQGPEMVGSVSSGRTHDGSFVPAAALAEPDADAAGAAYPGAAGEPP